MNNVINDRRNVLDLYQILRICKAYNRLGLDVQGQLDDLLHGQTEINQNAIDLIEDVFLRVLPPDAHKLLMNELDDARRSQE